MRFVLQAAKLARPAGEQVLVVDGASHASLFPRMRAIAHHCGAGTTATASRAGVPQVAVPHFVDQPLWALAIASMGRVRRHPCAQRAPGPLATPLRRCLDDVSLAEQARALRAELKDTDPLAASVRVVEGLSAR